MFFGAFRASAPDKTTIQCPSLAPRLVRAKHQFVVTTLSRKVIMNLPLRRSAVVCALLGSTLAFGCSSDSDAPNGNGTGGHAATGGSAGTGDTGGGSGSSGSGGMPDGTGGQSVDTDASGTGGGESDSGGTGGEPADGGETDGAAVEPPLGDAGGGDLAKWQYFNELTLDTTASGANVTADVAKYPVPVVLTATNFDLRRPTTRERTSAFRPSTASRCPIRSSRGTARPKWRRFGSRLTSKATSRSRS